METPSVYNFGSDGANNALPFMAMNNGLGGWGGIVPGFLGGILGGALFGGGFGGWGNNNGAAAASLGAQATANNNTDLLMNAVGNVGTQVAAVNGTLGNIAIQNATNPLQVVNAIQAGNAGLSQQFSQCCCENRLGICEQTNTIVSAIKDQTVAMNEQFCALQQRELQQEINAKNEIIAQLRDQAQTATIINALRPAATTTTTAGA